MTKNLTADELVEELSLGPKFQKAFLERRKVFLWGAVDDQSAKKVIDQILYLENEKPGEEITFYINSPGGAVTSGMIIYDTMQMISSPVSTVCIGMAASMGSILLSGGVKGKRYIFPHGRVMIHQPALGGVVRGQASDLQITANQIQKTKQLGAKILAENCNKTIEQIMTDFDRDYWMDSKESLDYQIVDKIIDKLDF